MALKNVRAALIDLSGTLHIEDKATPGAIEALERLRNNNVKVRFVTNTTKESKEVLWRRLTSIGFNIQKNEIFTSLTAARELVEARQLRPLLMLEDEALEDFDGIKTENPNAVVVGLAPSKFGYDSMNAAFRLILAGASLIAIHKGRYYKKKDCLALGPGPFVAALEYATDSKAEVVGKPEPAFFLKSLEYLDSIPAETAMIGDDVVDDIGGAQNVGMKGILVKTGKYRFGDENKICPNPSFVCDSFSDAVKHILED